MALKEPYRVKTVVGDTQFSLTAKPGESLLVKGIQIYSPAADYLTIKTGNTTVGYWRVGGAQGNQLYCPSLNYELPNLFTLLLAKEIFAGYPIEEGETLIFTGVKDSDSVQIVEYSVHDAGDLKAEMPNGSRSPEYFFTSYGRYSGVLADGENLYATVQTPVEFPAFPFGDTAPAAKVMTLHGIGFTPFGYDESMHDHQQITTYLKMLQEREVQYDDDRAGLPARGYVGGNQADLIYVYSQGVFGDRTNECQREPLWFTPPLEYRGNEELHVYVTTSVVAGSAKIAAVWAEVAFLFTVKPD